MNSRGGTTTTYLIPEEHLPLVLPFKYLGSPQDTLNQLDAILLPRVNAGYSRNDDPATAPVQVDPVRGFDPAEVTAPANEATFSGSDDPLSKLARQPDVRVLQRSQVGRDVTPTPQSSILSILHGRASMRPDEVAFTFTEYEPDPEASPRV